MIKILLIDASAANLTSLSELLRKDYCILTARNEHEAISILKTKESDVSAVILSAYLPGGGSLSFLSMLREDAELRSVPVILCIKRSDDATLDMLLKSGANECITSPYNAAIIRQRIDSVIRLRHARADAEYYYRDMLFASQLVDDSYSAVFVCDADNFDVLYVNKNCAKFCGRDIGEANGAKCFEFLKGKHKPCEPCSMQSLCYDKYSERVFTDERSGRHYITRERLLDWDGRRALVKYFVDDTERINAQQSLSELLDELPSGLGVFYMHPDNSINMTYLNNGYYKLVGGSREEDEESPENIFFSAMHPDDVPRLKQALVASKDDNGLSSTDIRIMHESGQYKWLNVRCRLVKSKEDAAVIYASYNDIDAEKKAQLQLEASARVLDSANEVGSVSIWLYNTSTKQVTHDLLKDSVLGYPDTMDNVPESVVESGLVLGDDVPEFYAVYERIFAGAERSECTVRLKNNKTNSFEWQHIVLSRLHDDYYGSSMVFGMTTNVNHQQETRLRYERELQLRRQLLRDAQVYYSINLTTGVFEEYQSKYSEETLVVPLEKSSEEIRQEILSRVFEADRDIVSDHLLSTGLTELYKAGKRETQCVYRRLMPDGSYHWVKSCVNISEKPDSSEVIAFIYVNDVDRETKDSLAAGSIIDEELETTAIVDVVSGYSHLLRAPEGLSELLGKKDFNFAELAARLIEQNVSAESIPACKDYFNLENLKAALQSKKTEEITFAALSQNGEPLKKQALAFYLDETHSSIVITLRDITRLFKEQQQQNNMLQKAADVASEANEAKSVFVSRVSHDLRTPLNAVLGLTELAKEENNPPKTADYIKSIGESGRYMLGLINDVLDLSRIESGGIELVEEPYPTADFARSVETVIRPQMNAKHLDFVFDLDKSVGTISVDKMRFCQIFFNLLSNAAKFTDPGGRVEFISKYMQDDERGRCKVRFWVRDNGRGMSEAFQKRLFQPFSQETPGSELQGTGLGLAIVKKLVDAFGGDISVKSELGRGTEFVIDLYLNHSTEYTAPKKSDSDYSHLVGLHILLVEDNAINIFIAQNLLEKRGCIVDVAKNGLESITMFNASAVSYYDAILMDVRMPLMNGLEATQQIRAIKRGDARTVPIIAMTANAFSEEHDVTLQAGMNAHVSKPVDVDELYRTILSLVESRPPKNV